MILTEQELTWSGGAQCTGRSGRNGSHMSESDELERAFFIFFLVLVWRSGRRR